MSVLAVAEKAICAKPTAAINVSESAYQCERAKSASSTQKTIEASIMGVMAGFLLPQAIQSAESSEPRPKADERKPKPAAPIWSTSVAKSGSTTLKLIPN